MTRVVCPPTMQPHAARVLAGEYDVPGLELPPGAIVLDIGANVGAFTIWARKRWPGCKVIGFEPHPDNIRLYRENCGDHVEAQVSDGVDAPVLVDAAIVDNRYKDHTIILYDGRNNCGEASIWRGDEQTASMHEVLAMHASSLPPCAVLKVDTEGCEVGILQGYGHLAGCSAVMLEWHRAKDRWILGERLAARGFRCVRDEVRREDRGIMCWRKP